MSKRSGKFYSKNEKQTMRKLGLRPTIASGASWIDKEDGSNDFILCQHKSTDANSYSLKRMDMDKLEYHAAMERKIPVFVVEFLSDNELYLIVKPSDIVAVAEYLTVPESKRSEIAAELVVDEEEVQQPQKMIKSVNKDKYTKNREKELSERYGNFKKLYRSRI